LNIQLNILGIDFEDWFHPELIKQAIGNGKREPSVINGIDKIINLLRINETFATFFVVGELLEHKPDLLDKILENGHEIAFHTMYHTRLDTPGFKEEFQNELSTFAKLTSGKSRGFRAPTFSLNNSSSWAISMLEENNYLYDSSIVPVKTSMYGVSNAEIHPYRISSKDISRNDPKAKLLEFPLIITRFIGKKIPAAGGFYLRTLPFRVTENAIRSYEKKGIPATFYVHSWELTPEFMPKIKLSRKNHFVTYHNIEKTSTRLAKILKIFEFTSFERYISSKAYF